LRLSSIEPMEYTPELIDIIVTSDIVCPHVHMPLQSGSDGILSRMNRPYSLQDYRDLLVRLRQRMPDLAVTTDIIVGFPGETEADHVSTLEFVRECGFAGVHVFPYSKRQGTPAADYPDQVSKQIKDHRVKELMSIARQSREDYIRGFLGKAVEVLIERVDQEGNAVGHTPHYVEVHLPSCGDVSWKSRQFVQVILKEDYIRG
jgi:threonylcarbamoyladenosine tRNA methylthiotransferase MtaB